MPAELLYPSAPGCCAAVRMAAGQPRECGADPAGVVLHRYRYPQPHTARLMVCEAHREGLEVVPLADEDRAELARRRRVRDDAYRVREQNRPRA